jgi:hypothetical protein
VSYAVHFGFDYAALLSFGLPNPSLERKMAEESSHQECEGMDGSLINLHIAEYNALTNRNTGWMNIQQNVWMLMVLSLTLMAAIWAAKPQYFPIILWVALFVVQAQFAVLCFATQEIYRNVYYIECDLRPSIQQMIERPDFWQYEPFLANRSGRKPLLTDAIPAALSTITVLIVVLVRIFFKYHWAELAVGLPVNLAVTGLLVAQTNGLVNLRKKFESSPG